MKISNATRWPLAATVLLATAAQAYQPAGQFKTEEQAKNLRVPPRGAARRQLAGLTDGQRTP